MKVAGLTAQAVADLVGGRLLGDGAVTLSAVGPLDRAGPEVLSLAVSQRYAGELRDCRAGAVLIPESLAEAPSGAATRIVVRDPHASLVRVIEILSPGPSRTAGMDRTPRIGRGDRVGAGV
ncbi:MAG: LpxD N-terminal domain-containing protein, partial [Gemmatimonadales bacterium]